jgi:hypothetical protein
MASTTTLVPIPCSGHPRAAPQAPLARQAISKSAAGEVSVTLQRRAQGLTLEHEERRAGGGRIVVVAAFTEAASFQLWCADDPLRHQEPIVHQMVRRHAEELWQSHP